MGTERYLQHRILRNMFTRLEERLKGIDENRGAYDERSFKRLADWKPGYSNATCFTPIKHLWLNVIRKIKRRQCLPPTFYSHPYPGIRTGYRTGTPACRISESRNETLSMGFPASYCPMCHGRQRRSHRHRPATVAR